ncbi:hypothetical protein Bca101_016689 [Brassica carinata]
MAYQPNLDPTPPSSVAPRHWWSRPMMTIPPSSERTVKYFAATYAPDFSALFTFGLVFLIFSFIHDAHSHAKISLQSLAVSSATWQADFLVKNPSSSYSIYYDGDSAAVRLGSRNAAILNITNQRVSRDHTAFSLSFVAEEGNRSNVVSEDLKIRLMGKHKRYTFDDEAGFFNIRCQHVTRGRESSEGHIRVSISRSRINAKFPWSHFYNKQQDNLNEFGPITVCHVANPELFAHSVSVSNSTNAANVSTADWRTGLVAKSPVTRCKLSLHTVTSRLLRGDEVISKVSPSFDEFGRLYESDKTDAPVTIVDFKKVVTPVVNGSVVWDYRVESVVGLKAKSAHGFLSVICRDIPVKFTADEAGNVVGSLLGGMRPCEYSLRDNLDPV